MKVGVTFMSYVGQCVEARRKKRKSINVEEMARQYFLLAKATMADRNVSSIYMIRLDDLPEAEFSYIIDRFRHKMGSLVLDEDLEAVILTSLDLSTRDRNELAQLVDSSDRDSGIAGSKRSKACIHEVYFQLQRARVQ
jgi:hypothetical protein